MEIRKRGASGSRDAWGARARVLWCCTCMCAVVDACGCATRVSLFVRDCARLSRGVQVYVRVFDACVVAERVRLSA